MKRENQKYLMDVIPLHLNDIKHTSFRKGYTKVNKIVLTQNTLYGIAFIKVFIGSYGAYKEHYGYLHVILKMLVICQHG